MIERKMFEELERINARPKPFEFYTASDLWADEHTSEKMLAFHLGKCYVINRPGTETGSRNPRTQGRGCWHWDS